VKLLYITDQKLPRKATDTDQFMAMVSAFGQNGIEITLLSSKSFLSKQISEIDLSSYFSIEPSFKHKTISSQLFGLRFLEKPLHGFLTLFSSSFREADVIYSRSLNNIIPATLFTKKLIFLETYKTLPDNSIFLKPLLWILKKKKNFKGIITHSDYAAQSFLRFGFKKEQLRVEHNGLDLGLLEPALSKKEARDLLGLPQDAFILSYSGTVSMDKGLELFFPVAEKLKEITFMIIGSKGKGNFENLAKAYPNIIIKPWMQQSELIPYLYASDCLCIPPSDKPLKQIGNTVLPIKTFIYMASNRPIIAPNTPDLVELLKHEKNALLVEPGDEQAFQKAIIRIQKETDFSNKLALLAKEQMSSNTWVKRAKRIIEYCETQLN